MEKLTDQTNQNQEPRFDTSLWEKVLSDECQNREKNRQEFLKSAIIKLNEFFLKRQVDKVFLVGSILKEGRFYPFSDIDIAVEGLVDNYFQIISQLEELLERNIDLIELENCRFREAIEKNGLRVL